MDPRRQDESDKGPGVQAISDLLHGAAGRASVERFARAVIANQVLGAPDAHGKNDGLLLVGSDAGLAPLDDLATGLIPDAAGRLRWTTGAMSIGGERWFGDVERGNTARFRAGGQRGHRTGRRFPDRHSRREHRRGRRADPHGLELHPPHGRAHRHPFLETLPGQGRVRAGSQVTGASLAESDVELTAADDQSEQGGA